ncbi:uncharacterized protein V6R79_023146 [Siganus canaliculatus]
MPAPATEDWRGVAEGFRDRWAFPNCVRSIDEKHVVFKAPDNSGSLLYNYKWCHPDSDSGPPCGDVVRGFTIDESCRKRWKGLRDTYLKERRKKAEESRSGSAAGTGRGWKHSAVVSFLDPFVSPRETSSNMLRGVEEDLTAEYFHPSEAGPSEIRDTNYEWAEGESGEGGEGETEEERDTAAEERPGERAGARAGEDAGAFSAAKPPGKRAQKRRHVFGEGEMDELIMSLLRQPPPPPPPQPAPQDEDEVFFKSLLPALKRLSQQQKETIKFQIHRFIFEASTYTSHYQQLE